MEATMELLSKLQKRQSSFGETSNKTSIGDVYVERGKSSINEFYLFLTYYNRIPNFDYIKGIDCRKANAWLLENKKAAINDCSYIKRYLNKKKISELDDLFYFLYDDLLVNFDIARDEVRFLYRNTSIHIIEPLIESIRKFKKPTKRFIKPEISLLVRGSGGFGTRSLEITKPKLSIEDNYNCDFKDIHQTIQKRLSKKNDKGLVLLHGKPGTGKTSYIRYLIASVKKEVIFLPPNMASAITNPDLLSVLIENPNSIFVIEDAENIVIDRERNGASPVSALLNISDGLLSDCLNIQIICSFNTDISKVDSALLRKGRLIAQYEFKELEFAKAQTLSNKLGFDNIINRPMTLTEIYNQNEQDFTAQKQRRSIGFGAG